MARKLLWGVPALAYLVFALWYTNLGGALTEREISSFLAGFRALGYDEARLQRAERFMREDDGRQFIMVNSIDLAEDPSAGANEAEGPEAASGSASMAQPLASAGVREAEALEALAAAEGLGLDKGNARDLLGHYLEFMIPELLSRACHPVYTGDALGPAMDLYGLEGARTWDLAGLMRYRSRRDVMEIAVNPAFQERHGFKLAALTKTIAYPTAGTVFLADLRWALGVSLLALLGLLDLILFRRSTKQLPPPRGSAPNV